MGRIHHLWGVNYSCDSGEAVFVPMTDLGRNSYGLVIRKRVPYLTCTGSLEDIYLIDALFHKYSVDGGTTTTGHLERYYGDYTISVEAEGYETQQYIGNITDELFLNLTMRPQKQIATTQDGVFINTDPSDLTDDLNLIKI